MATAASPVFAVSRLVDARFTPRGAGDYVEASAVAPFVTTSAATPDDDDDDDDDGKASVPERSVTVWEGMGKSVGNMAGGVS